MSFSLLRRAGIGIKEQHTIFLLRPAVWEGGSFPRRCGVPCFRRLSDQTVHLLIFLAEPLAFEFVLDFVAR